MRQLRVASFKDLMDGHDKAEIVCPIKGEVVRRLAVRGGMVEIDAITTEAVVDIDTSIDYQPWFMDRGSLVFENQHFPGQLKICTELDVIRFPNGDQAEVMPAE